MDASIRSYPSNHRLLLGLTALALLVHPALVYGQAPRQGQDAGIGAPPGPAASDGPNLDHPEPTVGPTPTAPAPAPNQTVPAAPEQTAPATAEAGPVLRPPELLQFAQAQYPAAALAAGLTAQVELVLIIGVDGTVLQCTVATPVGHGFDEAAQAAGLKLRFRPATRDGDPIQSKVRFPYVFELTPAAQPEPTEQDATAPAEFAGRVLNHDKQPVDGASVHLLAEDGSKQSVTTDATGRFELEPTPAGTYTVRIEAESFQPRSETETLTGGERTTVVYQLEEPVDRDAYGAVARIPPPPREVTRRSIGRTQLTRIPGTRGDALRAVELMPGVARPPFGAGALIIRGSAPQDSQVQLEGAPLPLLFHFGGITSAFNSHLLQSVEFFPGNFSARYGRRRGGIVEVNVRDPEHERYAGLVDINLIDAYGVVEGPITDELDFALAFRRSYVDLVFDAVVPEDEVGVVAAPVYYDYQAIATYRPTEQDRVRLMLFGSSDRFEILFAEPASETGGADDLALSTQFHRMHASWYRNISDTVDHDLELAVERRVLDFGLGDTLGFKLKATAMTGRSEWTARLADSLRLIGGLDVLLTPGRVEYTGPPVAQGEGNQDSRNGDFSARDTTTYQNDFLDIQPAGYVELDIGLGALRLVPGLRVDYYSLVKSFSVDPRISGVYTLNDSTRLKAGVGLFSQPPQPQETVDGLGNPDLNPMKTLHSGAGIEYDVEEGFNLGAEVFYKHLFDLVVSTEFGAEPRFVNGGSGRIYGLELSAKIEPKGRFFGYASYTLSRSERKDVSGGYRLFDFDQTHILTLSSVYRLGAGWELGGTFRLVSGNPDTPVTGGITGIDAGTVQPQYGRTNSIRSPMFHRLDVLVRKTWDLDIMKFSIYLDIQNIYNRQNPEGTVYGQRYKQQAPISGLPILPNLGLRGEF